ncbi:MAG: alginate lyase family protein [Lentisphaeria bacterium]|nr:alginate lyase family protein [Lentisphaeria bacterium]
MMVRVPTRAGVAALIGMTVWTTMAEGMEIDSRLPDREFFRDHLDLAFEGLRTVKAAVEGADYAAARRALAEYYRQRQVRTWLPDPEHLDLTDSERTDAAVWGRKLLAHEVLGDRWTGRYTIDWWRDGAQGTFARMYWLDNLARAYLARDRDPEIARTWVGLVRGFIEQCPPPADGRPNLYWEGLTGGCRLRGSWPLTFHVLAHSEAVTADDIVVFLKSLIEQCEFLRRTHWPAGNKITFAMIGLYSSGIAFPELKLASEWREYALTTAQRDLEQGYLPDGMGVELSPGYHTLFYNYLRMVDIARAVGRGDDPLPRELARGCERLFEVYATLALPDRQMPRYQDGGSTDAKERLTYALRYYPQNGVFQWFASDGDSGFPPAFRSVAMPHAGYIAMRTGWERDAVYVGFDVGPIGFGHAHQDKLNLVLWAYDRMLLMDPGHGDYGAGDLSRWAMDTFAHNTALVDDRPQRRRWGKSGGSMPRAPLTDFAFETGEGWDRAAGVYDGAYGLPGPSESYPYARDGNFHEGWGKPATHHRRVFFFHPDVVIVADDLVARDGRPHRYEVRWHVDSTAGAESRGVVTTRDPGSGNVVIAPLDPSGLTVGMASARKEEPVLGWNFLEKQPKPATTVRHVKSGPGGVRFVTLLLSVRPGSALGVESVAQADATSVRFVLSDRRRFEVGVPDDPAVMLSVASPGPGRQPPDANGEPGR